MFVHSADHAIGFSLFSQFPELICAFSTKTMGNSNPGKGPKAQALPLLSSFGLSPEQLVVGSQVHGVDIDVVDDTRMWLRDGVDGLISTKKNLVLGVRASDCVPLFFYAPKFHMVGAAHAGWKGTSEGMATKMIEETECLGVHPEDLYVAIGPHIGACCYTVDEKRASAFIQLFGDDRRICFEAEDGWHLDIGQANLRCILEKGILKEHIDSPPVCTRCQSDLFFSYRRRNQEVYGDMLGIISMKG